VLKQCVTNHLKPAAYQTGMAYVCIPVYALVRSALPVHVCTLPTAPALAPRRPQDLMAGVRRISAGTASQLQPLRDLPPLRVPRPGALPTTTYRKAASAIALQLLAMLVGRSRIRFLDMPAGVSASNGPTGALWRLKGPGLVPNAAGPAAAADSGALGAQLLPRQAAGVVAALGRLHVKGVHMDARLLRASLGAALAPLMRHQARTLREHARPADVAALCKVLVCT
jgi:hypothetical protein